jgi:hypothetical protein
VITFVNGTVFPSSVLMEAIGALQSLESRQRRLERSVEGLERRERRIHAGRVRRPALVKRAAQCVEQGFDLAEEIRVACRRLSMVPLTTLRYE